MLKKTLLISNKYIQKNKMIIILVSSCISFFFQLTAKNIQCMRSLLAVAHCHGGILGTAWHLVLTTLQVCAWKRLISMFRVIYILEKVWYLVLLVTWIELSIVGQHIKWWQIKKPYSVAFCIVPTLLVYFYIWGGQLELQLPSFTHSSIFRNIYLGIQIV